MVKKKDAIKYSEALEELQDIVRNLQDENIDVDELSDKVKRATALINICKQKIQDTEFQVKTILNKFEKKEGQDIEKD